MGQLTGGLISGTIALLTGVTMTGAAWGWSVAAATGTALGVVFLYRGLGRGRMSVVAPLSGIGAAALPVVVGFADGERPGTWAVIGLVAAIPAILLVAHARESDTGPSGWSDGLIAGVGFGLSFVAVSRLPHGSGIAGLSLMQLIAGLLIGLSLTSGGAEAFRLKGRYVAAAAVAGVMSGSAIFLFQVASHRGYLSEAAVLSALYPAVTVVLAMTLLRERVSSIQVAGFALCVASIGLIVSG